jgi:hypothetical protein
MPSTEPILRQANSARVLDLTGLILTLASILIGALSASFADASVPALAAVGAALGLLLQLTAARWASVRSAAPTSPFAATAPQRQQRFAFGAGIPLAPAERAQMLEDLREHTEEIAQIVEDLRRDEPAVE